MGGRGGGRRERRASCSSGRGIIPASSLMALDAAAPKAEPTIREGPLDFLAELAMGSRSTRHHSEQDESRGASARANGATMTAGHMTEREVKKLKKAELKAALEARGLETDGLVKDLKQRLWEYLESHKPAEVKRAEANEMVEKEAKTLNKAQLLFKLKKNNLSCLGYKEELLER